jgi:hypothetical protein
MTPIKTTLRCGDTLHVLVAGGDQELRRLVEETTGKLLKANGAAVEAADGSAVWINDEQEHPYVWSQDGNRVRARRVQYTRAADGRVESQVLRRVFVSP